MADSDSDIAASAPKTELRLAMGAPGVPAPAARAGFPAPAQQAGPPMAVAAAAKPASKRSGVRRLILPLVILAAVGYGGKTVYDYFVEGRFLVSTDDAYVGASTAIIAAKAMGHLLAVPVVDNQIVHQGDLLAQIDDGDYQNAIDAARARIATQEATIARFSRQIDAQAASIAQAEAQVANSQAQLKAGEADVERAALEYDRSYKLAKESFGSQQRLEQATADKDKTAASLAAAKATAASTAAALEWAKANLDVLKAQREEAAHTRDELKTALAKAERDLSFTRVLAPFDGTIGNKAAEVGNFVQPGTRLMALVPLNASYVDANFKETQLADIKVGQTVDVAIDALGGKVVQGTVSSIAPASGSQFSLLPPDNATGNFTKVVQRVPVRVIFADEVLKSTPLRPGLSVVATVHTRDPDAPRPTLLGALGLGDFAAKLQLAKP
jgi:membrane fusion protein (multidrug efflux system)